MHLGLAFLFVSQFNPQNTKKLKYWLMWKVTQCTFSKSAVVLFKSNWVWRWI